MDCPDRERAQWWGDVTNEMMMFMYCLDEKAYNLYEKGLYTKFGVAMSNKSSVLNTVVPTYNCVFELPMQEKAGICGMWEYYLYTGNKQALTDAYKFVKDYLYRWWPMDNGLMDRRTGTWDWPDWGSNPDVTPLDNAWYCSALNTAIKMAKEVGKEEDIPDYEKRRESIEKAFEKFWTSKGYKSAEQDEVDDRCNAIAVLNGIAGEAKYKTILNLLKKTMNSSPYMEKYVLDAMCKIGTMEDVQKRIKTRYHEMVEGELAYSTLWEFWDRTKGTKNHAWSGGPLITMSKFMGGVAPTTPGYETYKVEPNMGTLKHIDMLVPSIKGNIKVELNRDRSNKWFELRLTAPADAVATVFVPCTKFADNADIELNTIKVVENGKYVGGVDGVKFVGVENGKYVFEVAEGQWDFYAKARK